MEKKYDLMQVSNMIKHIGLFFLFLCIGFFAVTGVYLLATRQHLQLVKPVVSTQFSLDKAPSESLAGNISILTGTVLWQSRSANAPIAITTPRTIQQGEMLETGPAGQVTVVFAHVATISAFNNTQFSIIQTLPANMVIQQVQGAVVYTSTSSTTPLSIRTLDLLVTMHSGEVSVTVDKDKSLITIVGIKGIATIAYTDTKNTTIVTTLAKGKTIVFDNNTKTVD